MFKRNKTQINTGAIGHADHGKTTLAAGITTVLAKMYGGQARAFDSINSPWEKKLRGLNIKASHVEYETPTRNYGHLDGSEYADHLKSLVSGASQLDGAILVVSATEGPMPETREYIQLAAHVGVPYLTAFLNKCDMIDDEELLELVEMETRDLLSQYDFPGDDTPVVHGSALKALEGDTEWEAKIVELAALIQLRQNIAVNTMYRGYLDTYISNPELPEQTPFLLSIQEVLTVQGGTMVTGKMERVIIKAGDALTIVGPTNTIETACTSVEISGKTRDEGRAGQTCGVLLRDTKPEEIWRGQVLTRPGSIKPHTHFEAEMYTLSKEEGGGHTPLFRDYRPKFGIRTADEITGTIDPPQGVETVSPGDSLYLKVTLMNPIALQESSPFHIEEDERFWV